MAKLPMCRICLAENVLMYVVVNRNLHKLYEKLTDIPFVTEDSRPILACFFCCTKLKQCYRLLRQCLVAEELFAQMMNEVYEPNPLIKQGHLEFCNRFVKSPIEHISIDNECQTESIAIKEELPAVCEGQDDIIEPKEEQEIDELEPKNLDSNCLDVANVLPHHLADLEDDEPLMEFKTKVEDEEVYKKKRRDKDTIKLEPENLDTSCQDVADILPHHSESSLEDDEPLMGFKTEVKDEEVFKKKRRAGDTIRTIVAKKPTLDDAITAEERKKEKSISQVIRITQKPTSNRDTYTKVPYKCDQRNFNRQIGEKHKCDECQRSFSHKGNLTKHIRVHTGEKPYKCNVCQQSFSVKGTLTQHIRVHTREKPYKCDVCQQSFSVKGTLTKHIRVHTGEKPHKCDVCERSFSVKGHLLSHIRIHTGEKPYKCDACQINFSQKCNLTYHIRIHTGEKPYKCDVCHRSFSVKGHLLSHTRIHTGEKPYKCDICQRSFSEKGSLTKHNRIHTGQKPYKCEVCQCSFSVKSNLTKHILIHTGQKPYKCDVCQRNFSEKGSLTKHIRKHTGEKR